MIPMTSQPYPMKLTHVFRNILFGCIFIFPSFLLGNTLSGPDPCTANDDCSTATVIPNVVSDQSFVCINGCNEFASPDTIIESCQMGDFPTVWYRLTPDSVAVAMNIEVYSSDIESPVISVFKTSTNCDDLEQVYLTGSGLACIIGSDGMAKAIGTPVDSNITYYIAISSLVSIGGNFDLCISTQSIGFVCVLDRSIEITARSAGGPLEGPFEPNEKVSFCLSVNEFTAEGNGCQWFQGIVPVFGNGWDPSSFGIQGQPVNASINGNTIGAASNGLYGASTWDWFNNVDYHYDNPSFNVGDHDGNGTLDMCNSVFESDCPQSGVHGACCGPCWEDNQGDLLPPGWFAYGINGTCATPGPPVGVDWGDGNSCGRGMGPWHFCFDLITRGTPDCLGDSTRQDLSLGFFTFSDGETGAWTGDQSVCAYDLPLKLSLKAKCGRVTTHDLEQLPPLCSGDTLIYQIEEPGVTSWEWNISPFWAVPYFTNHGENGTTIAAPLINDNHEPVDITGILIGHTTGTEDIELRKFKFKLLDAETCGTVSVAPSNGSGAPGRIRLYPMPVDERVMLEWDFELLHSASITIYNSHGIQQEEIPVSTDDGHRKQIVTSSWSPGIYLVRLSNSDVSYVTKLVKL